MILPVITYGSLLHLNPTMCQRMKLTSFHNGSVKIVNNSKHECSGIPSPYAITVTISYELVRKCLDENKHARISFATLRRLIMMDFRICKHSLKLPKLRLEYCRGSFYYMGTKVYNDLPLTIRTTETFNEFKEKLKGYVISNII